MVKKSRDLYGNTFTYTLIDQNKFILKNLFELMLILLIEI